MRFPGKWPAKGQPPLDMSKERQATLDFVRNRGANQKPSNPRDLQVQSASRGVFLTWKLPPQGSFSDIVGWRVYKNDENTLYQEIRDRGVRQCLVECTAGATPPPTNLFVCSINALGRESVKIQIVGKATAETGAPSVPNVPPGYNNENAGGADRGNQFGAIALL